MKKSLLALLLLGLAAAQAQPGYQPTPENLRNREAFQDRKFGLFIHWGIYSILGDGEWVMHNQQIPYDKYKRLANAFYPHDFDARKWVQIAKDAGMKYITITSRHHDGFSMFATEATPYNIVQATPFGRDPMKELAEACREGGLKLNFYYSLLDWGRKDYGFGKRIVNGRPEDTDWDSYIRFMKAQLTELLTHYGDVVGGIWFDGDWERKDVDWHYDEIYGLIHRLRPDVLIGNNHHSAVKPGEDYQMFEKDLPGSNSHGWNSGGVSQNLPLETCETINNSWGFNIHDNSYKSVRTIIQYLVKAACMNANFLLNVGPQPDGNIQPEFVDTLHRVGQWLAKYGESVYDTRGGILEPQDWGNVTARGKQWYVHILQPPAGPFIFLPGISQKIASVTTFTDRAPLKWKQVPEGLFIYTQGLSWEEPDAVIRVMLK
ncbi:MAG TPA: alpha-L-fucosidase [Chitinophagaceae bacterium]|nr:alpha-L-fucosidase [Chitinophagaceae bacterium]